MTSTGPAIAVRPLRFTDDLTRMRAFCETIGFRPRVESRNGGWLDLVGARGMVALHDAATSDSGGRNGETRLSFEVADADALCRRLYDAGHVSATVWDEAYGRVLSVADPFGVRIWADERSDDDYGFRRHTGSGQSPVEPVPVRRVPDVDTYGAFLALFDLVRHGAGRDRSIAAGEGGSVALRHGAEAEADAAVVEPVYATAEPLDQLLTRLHDAGHGDATLRDDVVYVTDPDGCPTVIHSATQAAR